MDILRQNSSSFHNLETAFSQDLNNDGKLSDSVMLFSPSFSNNLEQNVIKNGIIKNSISVPTKKSNQKEVRYSGHYSRNFYEKDQAIFINGRQYENSYHEGLRIDFKDKVRAYEENRESLYVSTGEVEPYELSRYSSFDDVIISTSFDDYITYPGQIFGQDGNDRLKGYVVDGGLGNDSIRSFVAFGKEGNDLITNAVPNELTGINEKEFPEGVEQELVSVMSLFTGVGDVVTHYLNGGDGDDLIYDSDQVSGHYVGGTGNDTLYGSISFGRTTSASSRIWNQPEIDWFTGGSGNDRFVLFDSPALDNGTYSWSNPTNTMPSNSAYFNPDSYAIITDFDLNDDKLYLPAIHTYGDKVTYESKSIIFDSIESTGIYASRTNSSTFSFDDDLVAVVHGISDNNFNINRHVDFIGTLGPNNYATSSGTYVADVLKTDPFENVNVNSDWSTNL